jgi:[ribosomal protein S5]-alanine N-acetyltransferase
MQDSENHGSAPILGRFLMRDIGPDEGPRIFALTGDRAVMKYMGFRAHDSVSDATKLIAQYRNSPSRWQAVCLDGEPTDILGILGFEVEGHQAAATIMFRRDWKARGAGREFSAPFVQWVFTHPQIWRMWAYCHPDNIAVQRVLGRMGAECEGRLRRFAVFPNISPEPQDAYIYSIIR